MNKFTKFVKDFWQDEEGLTAVEYAVAGSLIALAVVTAFTNLGTAVGDAINDMTNVINS
ncbi:Flp family type IVb pilin [Vibrio fluvialis]|mgnify:CR=1 FL=1|jgi:pilus assembly protein Flp/PilA|uniref:Flp family type IVb pilin n=1 Tax=Vibrio fluvialis TaxID=676 RepID=UPI00192B69C0|nr:Flp family type IVb pilin [Vibrio fluvialis]MBL4287932.1 Flp family type IVb pilin [Vibrio fluvialis]MBL4292372.1 Flp family type IVb pilin [Vibrio fluvialis]MBY7768998.1 Flp family type IVb pilin [Vibrio fluvialis]MCE7585164.1 Flp family type IVb pilin [Vibrio fluvialis]MCE7598548.1 Flp family type IVb pilin [Vibrio fluvialis]